MKQSLLTRFVTVAVLFLSVAYASDEEEDLTSWFVVPGVFFTPETTWGAGLTSGYFYKEKKTDKSSNLLLNAIYTLRKQASVSLASTHYAFDQNYRFQGKAKYSLYPDRFFGLGPNPLDAGERFTPVETSFRVSAEKKLSDVHWVGLRYRFRKEKIISSVENGQFKNPSVIGNEGGLSSGLGLIASYDTRNSPHYSTDGFLVQSQWTSFLPLVGSDFEYHEWVMDGRYFVPIWLDHSVALQALFTKTFGDTPYFHMPGIGGKEILRGYYKNRYQDRMILVTQAEYRFPIYWRFLGTGFLSLGNTGTKLGDLAINPIKIAGGLGIRYKLNDDGFNIRIDSAYGPDGIQFYFLAGEAF